MEEGEGSSEMEFMNIDSAADSLDSSAIFHVVNDVLGFILFMHQQIPSVLQDITQEFDELRTEFKELEVELAKSEGKAISTRRKQASRKREVKLGIRKLEKLMDCISNLKTALQLVITEVRMLKNFSGDSHADIKGAGSDSYACPTKLFLMVKAPSYLNLPLHFLPKARVSAKQEGNWSIKVPFRLRFRCRTWDLEMNAQPNDSASSVGLLDSTSKDLIWY
ncbi:hypothetical protein DH2020_001548 [Rehmannia glutinosa]|uniref:Uncharacterized protein n=1 Tax=Rehmannia glutinosa TaxID=99300 RepID=A0ABR0Y0E7_REHGL